MQKNHSLARSIADASWGELNRQLAYKAQRYGRSYEQVVPQHTSQDCSVCGYRKQDLKLVMQEWIALVAEPSMIGMGMPPGTS